MNTRRTTIAIVATLALLAGASLAGDAQAVEIQGELRADGVRIHLDSRGGIHAEYRIRGSRPAPVRVAYRLFKRDRQIARRLARYTGVPRRELLELRMQGYRWREIGRWLGLRPRVVQAAWSGRTWQLFLHQQQCFKGRGKGHGPRRAIPVQAMNWRDD